MNNEHAEAKQFDHWLTDDSNVAALVMHQWLESVEGGNAVIFPPTYAKPTNKDDWNGYNIDYSEDGSNICQIDSVGAQANRMEPIFLREKYKELVPGVSITASDRTINLLEAGHRAADAVVRFSDMAEDLRIAFKAAGAGDVSKLAKIAPTTLVFGAWDSRDTQVKLPRIIRSVIRAFNVKPLHRSAQYIPPIDYVKDGLLDEVKDKTQQKNMSELGLSHAPAPWTHGGILVGKEIRRDATLSLPALRALGTSKDDRNFLTLRRYILGLSLVALTAPQEYFLREGCQLVPENARPAEWSLVFHDGKRESIVLAHNDALKYATTAAKAFGVGKNRTATFNAQSAKKACSLTKVDRKQKDRIKDGEHVG